MKMITEIPTAVLLEEINRRGGLQQPSIPPLQRRLDRPVPIVALALRAVARAFRSTAQEILGPCREEHLVRARFATWLLLEDLGMTRREIARAFQRQDCGTIRHGSRRGKTLVQLDKAFSQSLWEAYESLQRGLAKMSAQQQQQLCTIRKGRSFLEDLF